MWSYFKLLFSKHYWRLLFRPHTWRETGLALRRAHKDKRARKQLRLALTLIFTPVICLFYLLYLVSLVARGGVLVVLAIAVVAGGVALWRSRGEKDATPPSLLESPAPVEPDRPIPPETLRGLGELALLHAILANRAGSESYLATKTLPEGWEVTTRRNHVALLRQHGLWERLGGEERDLLLLPDGHWPPGMVDRVALLLEPLRVLRWTLRIDDFLPTIGSTLRLDYQQARSLLDAPELALNASRVIAFDHLRVARQAANAYFQRCAAEGVRRGYFEAESEENAAWSHNFSASMEGKESDDLLLGTTIVARADEGTIRYATLLSLRRLRFVDWLVAVLRGELALEEELRVLEPKRAEVAVE
ncbi:hypothetical protein SAMN05421770_107200 [Granulicella rosea]|uniref:Uncharacterized protein n=1 Tax=Granulicella rosea TaxID=474952 RepID=A0A239LQP0_9BACT|nr:hypothetical protein [Granulicella rosea]SNT32600.1 hypothetical protein SAMN05421770_107200 [Granulicella rosea]